MLENGKLSFNMDYRQVFFLCCDDADRFHIRESIRGIQNNDPVLFHNPRDDEVDLPFSLAGGAHYVVGDSHFTRREGEDTYQLIFTCAGKGVARFGETRFECAPGTVLLLDCRQPHEYNVPKKQIWNFKHIHFKVNASARRVADRALGFIEHDNHETEAHMNFLFEELRNFNNNSPYLISNRISNMLTELILLHSHAELSDSRWILIEKAAEYMRANYMNKINIAELAQSEFLSVYYFSRLFKSHFGLSPYDYLIHYRLMKAKHLLILGENVKKSALLCGFDHVGNFSRIFNKYVGVPPSEFQRQRYKW
ncbi:MAG: AraC family transcriptional regulator [Oscillospiraceae bacterium]|jgi:AraC-like DNA-binding protein|nr:AraC family transcriptional regulator [Oscillospiraceae bacterium]